MNHPMQFVCLLSTTRYASRLKSKQISRIIVITFDIQIWTYSAIWNYEKYYCNLKLNNVDMLYFKTF